MLGVLKITLVLLDLLNVDKKNIKFGQTATEAFSYMKILYNILHEHEQ